MEKHYANQGCTSLADARPVSPIESALNRLGDEIGEIHCFTDLLITDISPVLRNECPTASDPEKGRLTASSPLAERIEQLAEAVRAARMKITAARDRLTL